MPLLYLGPFCLHLQHISLWILSNSLIPCHFISFHISFLPVSLVLTLATFRSQTNFACYWSLVVASQWRLVRSTSPYRNWLWWFNALLVLEVRMTQWWRRHEPVLIRLVFFLEVSGRVGQEIANWKLFHGRFVFFGNYMCDSFLKFLFFQLVLLFSTKDDIREEQELSHFDWSPFKNINFTGLTIQNPQNTDWYSPIKETAWVCQLGLNSNKFEGSAVG